MRDFSSSIFSPVWRKAWVLVSLNWLFFGSMVVGALLGQAEILGVYERPVSEDVSTAKVSDALLLVMRIFFLNLVLSGFLLVTLTGLVFFVLPLAFLLYRALLWSALLNWLPTPLLFVALPTLILEGEGYVLAALAGVNLGLAWLKPKWVYRGEDSSRLEALKKALKETAGIYVFVVIFLFVAAVVETAIIFSL